VLEDLNGVERWSSEANHPSTQGEYHD
jgi:hypothetical protein